MDERKKAAEGLKEVWDYLKGNPMLGDVASVRRGVLKDEDRPAGECWACGRFAEGAMLHEQPGTAECCKGCDAYRGEIKNG